MSRGIGISLGILGAWLGQLKSAKTNKVCRNWSFRLEPMTASRQSIRAYVDTVARARAIRSSPME